MKKQLLGALIMIITFGLTCYVYDWKLAFIFIAFLWGNNLESKK